MTPEISHPPYITKMKKKLELHYIQVACLNRNIINSQSTEKYKLVLKHLNINDVKVPKHMAYLLEQHEFSNYFTICITKALLADPKKDVTTIKVDWKFFTFKTIHAKVVSKVFKHFKSEEGKQVLLNEFRAVLCWKFVLR